MGYKIVYGRKQEQKPTLLRIQVMICSFLLAFALCVRFAWPKGAEAVAQILISDQLTQDAEAFLNMIQQVQAGERVTDVVAVFCREILHGENIP